MKNNLHVFLGSTVADAAARPLHWVYNQKKLLRHIRGKKDFTFLKRNKSPFYSIKTGKVSGYNDIGQVMFKTLIEGHTNIESRFKKNIIKNFGPGSIYWKNYSLRAKYRKVKDWRGIIKGPWIHQNIIETVQNIKKGKKLTGGRKVNESDGFCAALPYFLYGYKFKTLEKYSLLKQCHYEKDESLEQLRMIWNNIPIHCVQVKDNKSIGINSARDLKKAREIYEH